MTGLIIAIALLCVLVTWMLRVFPSPVRSLLVKAAPLALVALLLVAVFLAPQRTPACALGALLLALGGVVFTVERWRAGTADREARAKALAQARGQQRRRLPMPVPGTARGRRRSP